MTTTLGAINLPFDEAIAFLRQKANVTSENYTDVWGKANVKSFTVAGASTQALVDDFRREVAKALEQGTSLQEFRKSFDAIVEKHGWAHTGKPGFRSRIIFETNLGMAYSAGRYAQQTEPETLAAFPFWQYVHSGAQHPRLEHKSWDGKVLRADDPWWGAHYPPNGWRCGCRVRPLSARGLARQGKSGPDEAPPVSYVEHTNRKTGEVYRTPKGIDPGFDYNVGQEWTGRAPQIPANATLQPRTVLPSPAAAAPAPAPRPASSDKLVTVIPTRPPAAGAPIPRPPSSPPPPWRPPVQKELDLGPVPKARSRQAARPAQETRSEAKSAWPWKPNPRRGRFQMAMEGAPEKVGLFKNATEARRLARDLMAGVPEELAVRAKWQNATSWMGKPAARFVVDQDGVTLMRTFTRDGDRLIVEHDYFALSPRFQGGGHALRMLQTSFSAYERLGVAEVRVHANLDKGGYVWARNGFAPNEPNGTRDLIRRLAMQLTGGRQARMLKIAESSSDVELLYDVAVAADEGGRFGMQLLLGSNWWGHVDLTNPAHRELLAKALKRK